MPKGWTFMFLKSILNSHVSEWARTLDIKIGQKPYFSAIFGPFWAIKYVQKLRLTQKLVVLCAFTCFMIAHK